MAGQSTSARHHYLYTEARLSLRVYYRLHQVDFDGGEPYSPVVVLEARPVAVAVATVYPNPAREQAQLDGQPAGVVVRFYDEAGRCRRQQVLDDINTLTLRGLPPGSYHLVIGEGPKAARTRLTIL